MQNQRLEILVVDKVERTLMVISDPTMTVMEIIISIQEKYPEIAPRTHELRLAKLLSPYDAFDQPSQSNDDELILICTPFPPTAGVGVQPPLPYEQYEIRKWWHNVLRDQGKFSCYGIFLILPSDKEVIHYLTEYSRELDLISGENFLAIALSKNAYQRLGFDRQLWRFAIEEQAAEGNSLQVAKLFRVRVSEFPCLIIFQDIRSTEHIKITLKGLTADDIRETMRSIFSTIEIATSNNESPLIAIRAKRNEEEFVRFGKSIVSEIRSFAERTFEAAMEAWFRSRFK